MSRDRTIDYRVVFGSQLRFECSSVIFIRRPRGCSICMSTSLHCTNSTHVYSSFPISTDAHSACLTTGDMSAQSRAPRAVRLYMEPRLYREIRTSSHVHCCRRHLSHRRHHPRRMCASYKTRRAGWGNSGNFLIETVFITRF